DALPVACGEGLVVARWLYGLVEHHDLHVLEKSLATSCTNTDQALLGESRVVHIENPAPVDVDGQPLPDRSECELEKVVVRRRGAGVFDVGPFAADELSDPKPITAV